MARRWLPPATSIPPLAAVPLPVPAFAASAAAAKAAAVTAAAEATAVTAAADAATASVVAAAAAATASGASSPQRRQSIVGWHAQERSQWRQPAQGWQRPEGRKGVAAVAGGCWGRELQGRGGRRRWGMEGGRGRRRWRRRGR